MSVTLLNVPAPEAAVDPSPCRVSPAAKSRKLLSKMRGRSAAADLEVGLLDRWQGDALRERGECLELVALARAEVGEIRSGLEFRAARAARVECSEFSQARIFCAVERLNERLLGLVERLSVLVLLLIIQGAAVLAAAGPEAFDLRRHNLPRVRVVRSARRRDEEDWA